ncbi:hypothetical protein ACFFX1_11100 [Dactylosporangium sucinum]|uniref:Uncharacterized protein n=1 Tax=Dactylosporangium sucinum TaxID=1424081 RepID=A0A917WRC9_9ACTN|nr:hypothetical protein [Dactylosporangium sucinum]GGM22497.1 hypothetical protein GCM10007977_024570 [Dactylosporangium sucinum]
MKGFTESIADAAAFAEHNAGLLILVGLALTVAMLAWGVRRAVRSGRPDKHLAMVSLLIGFSWSAEAMWKVATQKLDLAPAFALFAFVVFETQLAVEMIRAERSQKEHGRPGKHGKAAWMIAVVMGCIAAAASDSFVEVLLRFAVPLLVTHQWWAGMTGDGVTKAADAISWTWTPRRLLVALGLARPGAQDLATVDRQRHIQAMVKLRHQLHLADKPGTKPGKVQRLTAQLHKLALNSDPDMLDEVRDKITLVHDSAERTRPLTAAEHALVSAARTEADQARRHAELAATTAEAVRSELAEARAALERSTADAGQTGEQVRQLELQLQQVRHEAELAVEQIRRDAEVAIGQARREAQTEVEHARHEAERAIAAARLQPVNGNGNGNGHHGYTTVPAAGSPRASVTSLVPAPTSEQGGGDVALPATAQACAEWMALWVKVCQDLPGVALGSQSISEDTARDRFGCSVRHLRKVRNAARGGGLRLKAKELGAAIPEGFVNEPELVNGYAAVS